MTESLFKNKVALVTGGTSGIGCATARALAQAGASVIITARDAHRGRQVAETLNNMPHAGPVKYLSTDLNDPDTIERLFVDLSHQYESLDIVVNNAAGETGVGKPLPLFTEAEFDQTMNVNVKAVWWCMKLAIQRMLSQQPAGGSIVNVSSVNGLGGVAGGSLYAASKAAVLALTKSAALEYASLGIKINAFVPGFFDTPLLEKAFVAQANDHATQPGAIEAVRQQYAAAIPLGRIASPDQAAQALLWLCDPQTPYLAGHALIMDGGLTATYR